MAGSILVADPWLRHIEAGRKTIEGRRGRAEKFADLVGKRIHLYNDRADIKMRVVEVRHYENLYTYLSREGWRNVMPDPSITSYYDAVDAYHKIPGYSDGQIRESGGMCAIVLAKK